MLRFATVLAVWSILAGAASAKLEIKNIQAAYGFQMPVREKLEYFPENDGICFRFFLTGLKTNKDECVNVEVAVKICDATGKMVVYNTQPTINWWHGVVDRPCLSLAWLQLTNQLRPGEYTAIVIVTDKIANESTSFERQIKIKPVEFAIHMPRLSLDAECKMLVAGTVSAGTLLHYHFNLIGAVAREGKVHMSARIEILDAAGHSLRKDPGEIVVRRDDVPPNAPFMPYFNGNIIQTGPGDYRLHVTVTDKIANKSATCDVPFHVVAP